MKAMQRIRENVSDMIYGLNDGLGAIFGLIAGVAGYSMNNTTILESGVFGAFASMMSMGGGAYQATEADNELEGEHQNMTYAAIAGGLSTLIGGLLPLVPFLFLTGMPAIYAAAALCFLVQFVTGALKTIFTKKVWWRSGLKMMFIGMIIGFACFFFGRIGQMVMH